MNLITLKFYKKNILKFIPFWRLIHRLYFSGIFFKNFNFESDKILSDQTVQTLLGK